MIHVDISIQGRVQGVGFRFDTRRKAQSLGIKGNVKNRPDGTVKIEAEGNQNSINDFIQWCKKGPPMAKVTNINIFDGPIKNYNSFDIIH
jgi:acylphosphatase